MKYQKQKCKIMKYYPDKPIGVNSWLKNVCSDKNSGFIFAIYFLFEKFPVSTRI